MKIFIIPLLVLLSLVFGACDTYLVLELPTHQPKFVINTSLEVGKPIHVFVSKSRGVLEDNDFERVDDAKVEIIVENDKAYTLHFEEIEHNGFFMHAYRTRELEIETGKTYEVVVTKTDMPTARGKVTVPNPVGINSVELRSAPRDNGAYVDFVVGFENPVGDNFFELNVHTYGRLEHYDYTVDQYVSLKPKNPIYQNDFWNRLGILFDDKLFREEDGQIDFHAILFPNVDLDVTIYLKSVTEGYFNYDNSLSLQGDLRGDPLAQPVQVYNNIEGGFGIVKAASTTTYKRTFNNTINH